MSVKRRKLSENNDVYALILQPTKEKLVIRLSLFRFNQKMQSRCEPRLHFFYEPLANSDFFRIFAFPSAVTEFQRFKPGGVGEWLKPAVC